MFLIMSLEQKFRASVSNHLESLSTKFEQELKVFFKRGFSKDVAFLQVEYESQIFQNDLSVYLFALNREGQLEGDVHWFLEKQTFVIPAEMYYPVECSEEEYENIEPWGIASDILEAWLIERWKNAGQNNLPTYLAHHDSYFMRNIENGTTTNWDEIMEKING